MTTSGNHRQVGFVLQFDEEFVSLKCFPPGDKKRSKILTRRLSELPGINKLNLKIDQPLYVTFDAKNSSIIRLEDGSGKVKIDEYFPKTEFANIFNYPLFKPQVS